MVLIPVQELSKCLQANPKFITLNSSLGYRSKMKQNPPKWERAQWIKCSVEHILDPPGFLPRACSSDNTYPSFSLTCFPRHKTRTSLPHYTSEFYTNVTTGKLLRCPCTTGRALQLYQPSGGGRLLWRFLFIVVHQSSLVAKQNPRI